MFKDVRDPQTGVLLFRYEASTRRVEIERRAHGRNVKSTVDLNQLDNQFDDAKSTGAGSRIPPRKPPPSLKSPSLKT